MELTMPANSLQRRLGFWDSIAINVGIIIGVGIFRVPSEVAKHLDSGLWILFAWLLGGLIAWLGANCYAELSSRIPKTGGTYVFLREAYGEFIAFLFGWMEFWGIRAASIAALAYIISDYLGALLPSLAGYEKIIAILAIILSTLVNIMGLRLGTRIQWFLSALKVVGIVILAGIIFSLKGLPQKIDFSLSIDFQMVLPLFAALIPILWTYGGWHESSFMSGEFRDTQRALPLSILTTILIVSLLYMAMNAAYLQVFSPAQMVQSEAIASDAFMILLGARGKQVVAWVVVLSALGALNAIILTGGRIPFALSQDYPKTKWLAKIHPRFQTPARSLALNAIWAAALVFWGNFEALLYFSGFAIWLFFGLVGLSVLVLRRKHGKEDIFELWGYPYVPLLFSLCAFWLCIVTILYAPHEALMGALLLVAGVPGYLAIRR